MGTLLLGGDFAIEDPDKAIEIANHFADLYRFPCRCIARIKMTLVFHLRTPVLCFGTTRPMVREPPQGFARTLPAGPVGGF